MLLKTVKTCSLSDKMKPIILFTVSILQAVMWTEASNI